MAGRGGGKGAQGPQRQGVGYMLRRAERAVTANTNMHWAVSWLFRQLQCPPLDEVMFELEEGRQPQAPLVLQWLQERGQQLLTAQAAGMAQQAMAAQQAMQQQLHQQMQQQQMQQQMQQQQQTQQQQMHNMAPPPLDQQIPPGSAGPSRPPMMGPCATPPTRVGPPPPAPPQQNAIPVMLLPQQTFGQAGSNLPACLQPRSPPAAPGTPAPAASPVGPATPAAVRGDQRPAEPPGPPPGRPQQPPPPFKQQQQAPPPPPKQLQQTPGPPPKQSQKPPPPKQQRQPPGQESYEGERKKAKLPQPGGNRSRLVLKQTPKVRPSPEEPKAMIQPKQMPSSEEPKARIQPKQMPSTEEPKKEEKRGEDKRGRALEAKHLAQSWFKLHTLTLLLFSLLSMIFECLPPKRLNRDPAVDPRTTSFLMFELTLCQSCLWQPVQPYYWDILRSFLSWFFKERGTTSPQTGAISSSKARGFEKGLNLALCWKGQHIVLKSTTHCAEKHNTLCWKAQRTVLKSTTHCAEKHNAPCWKAQHTVLKSTTHCAEKHKFAVVTGTASCSWSLHEFCIDDSCTGRKAWSWDITDWGKQCIQGQGLHTGLAQRCQQNARIFCRKGTTLTIL